MKIHILKSGKVQSIVLVLVITGSAFGFLGCNKADKQDAVAVVPEIPAIVEPVQEEPAETADEVSPPAVMPEEKQAEQQKEQDKTQEEKDNSKEKDNNLKEQSVADQSKQEEPVAENRQDEKEEQKEAVKETQDSLRESTEQNNSAAGGREQEAAYHDLPSRSKSTGNSENSETTEPADSGKQAADNNTADNAEKEPKSSWNSAYDTTLNSYVLDVIETYKNRHYPYLLNNDYANYNGVTVDLIYQGRVLLKAHPSGEKYSHCSGITFEVFFKAMQKRNRKLGLAPDDFNGMTYDELFDFVMYWYVADGNKAAQNVVKAVEKYGLGQRVTRWEDARPGDFIDFSRENNTGHTVIFMNWLRDNTGRIIGLKYWSSQESTGGISYKEEYFNYTDSTGKKYGNVMSNMVFIARVSAVKDYR